MAKSKKCYALGDLLTRVGASWFGNTGAEPPIILDYLGATSGPLGALAPDPLRDWYDDSSRSDYIDTLTKRHPELDRTRIERDSEIADRLRWPDILTWKGLRFALLMPGSLLGTPVTGDRNEYYEIKPDSQYGLDDGTAKLDSLRRAYRRYGLKYKPGTFYPDKPRELPLVNSRVFSFLANILMRRYGIRSVRLYIQVSRKCTVQGAPPNEIDGLLFYKLCVEIETDDEIEKALANALAKHIVATYVVCRQGEEKIRKPSRPRKVAAADEPDPDEALEKPARELFVAGPSSFMMDGVLVPKLKFKWLELADPLKPLQGELEHAIYTRGGALPKEEHLICCDETFFRTNFIDPRMVQFAIQNLQVKPSMTSSLQVAAYAAGNTGWIVVSPIVDKAGAAYNWVEARFPPLGDMRKALGEFYHKHPDLTIAIIGVLVIATAAVASYAIAELALASFAAVETAAVVAEGTSVASSSGAHLGRAVLTEAVVEETVGQQAARIALQRTSSTLPQFLQQVGGRAANYNHLAHLGRSMAQPRVVKAAVAVAAAAGFTLAFNIHTAQAMPAQAPQTPPSVVPPPSSETIASELSRLMMYRGNRGRVAYGVKPPEMYATIDAAQHSPDLLRISPEGPEKAPCRYLGRVEIS